MDSSVATLLRSDALSHVAFSSCAAVVARTVAHPLDTLKTRIQFASSQTTALASTSLASLYRGLPVALLFSVPALSIYLGAYDASKAGLARWGRWGGEDSMGVHAAASCTAEVLSGALWTPMEVLKNKLQVQKGEEKGLSTLQLCRDIAKKEGARGFYKGYFLALGVFIPYTMAYFMSYEQLKLRATRYFHASPSLSSTTTPQTLPFSAYVLCSGLSGALAGAISNPLDIVKTRVQADSLSGGTRPSAFSIISRMWKEEGGARAFTRGMGARILWVTPTVTLSMSVYEVLKDWRAGKMR
ncbi:hypothetical protein HKX48_004197 [Thoreauomyces humboldtii]|nr:hypothetical protein HKX48_004197 [Thoreauomyces humboldtii]